jgi:hypothetical protein
VPILTTIDLPLLETSDGIYVSSNAALAQFSLPKLTLNTARLIVDGNDALTAISLDALTRSIGSDANNKGLEITDNKKLVSIGLRSIESCDFDDGAMCTGEYGIDISDNTDVTNGQSSSLTILLGPQVVDREIRGTPRLLLEKVRLKLNTATLPRRRRRRVSLRHHHRLRHHQQRACIRGRIQLMVVRTSRLYRSVRM